MKTKMLLLGALALIALCSCKQDTPEEKNLKEQLAASVDGSELGIDLKYELIGIQFVDTIYYGDTIKYYADKLDKIWYEPDKEDLKRDAYSARHTLGRQFLYPILDSLANLTTPIEKYDYNYIEAFYTYMYWLFEGTHEKYFYIAKDILDHKDLIKETIAIYDEMKSHAPDEIYGYRIKHEYKIFNPLLKCEQTLSEIITVNSKLEIL